VGRPGEGKSFLTTDMAARLSTGSPWPDGTPAPRGSVLLICAEDDPRDTICPRLMACGADLRVIHLLSMVRRLDEAGRPREAMFTLADIPALEAALKAHPDCQLVVVDPIGSFLSGGTDAHRDNEVRSVLGPVAKLAEQYGPAVLLVAHPRKSSAVNADDLALGSRAFTGMARAVWHLCRDPQDRTRRLLLSGKNNLAAESHGLAFAIAGEPPRIHWEKDAVMMNANDALAEEAARSARKPGSPPVARKDAQEWLCDLLSNGPLPARQIQAEGEAAGHSLRTLHRARAALGIRTSRIGPGGTYLWMPPGSDDADGTPLSDETQQATLPYAESVADGS
jgi:putative DNA primase/helicase